MGNDHTLSLKEQFEDEKDRRWLILNELLKDAFYTVLLCLYVADPATFLASNSVLGPYVPLRTVCLLT